MQRKTTRIGLVAGMLALVGSIPFYAQDPHAGHQATPAPSGGGASTMVNSQSIF